MKSKKALILEVLNKHKYPSSLRFPVEVIEEGDFGTIADEILSALQLNEDTQPPLPQAAVSSRQPSTTQAELAALPDELEFAEKWVDGELVVDNHIRIAAQEWSSKTEYYAPDNNSFAAGAEWMLQQLSPVPSEWISVETPPAKSGFYMVYDENKFGFDENSKQEIYRYSKDNDSWYWGSDCFHPQFWMPLPAPPQLFKQTKGCNDPHPNNR